MTLGERIREVRQAAQLTLAAVGTACGVTPQAVKAWEDGRSEPGLTKIIALSKITHASLEYILTGDRAAAHVRVSRGGRTVPRRQWPDADGHYLSDAPTVFLESHFECGPRSFAVIVKDAANEPLISRGDSVIIDPDQQPTPGDLVMVLLPSRQIVLRKFRPRQDAVELVAHNSDWPTETVPALDHDNFIGTLTEHTRPRR